MKRFLVFLATLVLAGCYYKKSPQMRICSRLDWQSVLDIFPQNVSDIERMKEKSLTMMHEMFDTLQKVPEKNRTYHNTVRVYDNARFKFIMNTQILSALTMLSPQGQIRLSAGQALSELQRYQAQTLVRNTTLLQAFQDYARYGNDDQSKTVTTRSFLQKSIERLEHEGANLSPEVREKLDILSQEISHLEGLYYANSAIDHHVFRCKEVELAGVPADFIQSLQRQGRDCLVPLNYQSFFTILENCTQADIRERFFIEFNRRVYKENSEILQKLVQKRYEYARLVGYKNFAEYEYSLQMIGSVQRARDFIYDVIKEANKTVEKEFSVLFKNLPSSVMLSHSGKLQPWDEAFVKNNYRKQHFKVDGKLVAQYFPISHVLEELQKQFGQFFALDFEKVSYKGLWHNDLLCLRLRRIKTSEIIGYIVFDLYARPGKSEQAHQVNVIPTIQDDCHLACSGLTVVSTNIVKAPEGQETLLDFYDLKSLLHEFGHALHELFGSTEFVDMSGTKGPRDFVEVPSQLFEHWLDNPKMIKMFSQHYKTHEKISDDMIERIIGAEKFSRASLLQRQCLLSLLSLELGCSDGVENIHDLVGKLYTSVRCDVQYDNRDYFETTFDYLITYGSHYYSYVWSQVLAAEIFDYVEKHGITNIQVGQKIYDVLLAPGGSQDPYMMIEKLLGTTEIKKVLLQSLKA